MKAESLWFSFRLSGFRGYLLLAVNDLARGGLHIVQMDIELGEGNRDSGLLKALKYHISKIAGHNTIIQMRGDQRPEIHGKYPGDTFFPDIDEQVWTRTKRDRKDGYSFVQYQNVNAVVKEQYKVQ